MRKYLIVATIAALVLSGCIDSGPHYKDCDSAREAGVAPLNSGDPGYRKALDKNGDGVACE